MTYLSLQTYACTSCVVNTGPVGVIPIITECMARGAEVIQLPTQNPKIPIGIDKVPAGKCVTETGEYTQTYRLMDGTNYIICLFRLSCVVDKDLEDLFLHCQAHACQRASKIKCLNV